MTPIGEKILRAMAIGRSKTAVLARLVLEAEGVALPAESTMGLPLSMSPAAIRKRRQRAIAKENAK